MIMTLIIMTHSIALLSLMILSILFSTMAFSIMAFSIMAYNTVLSINRINVFIELTPGHRVHLYVQFQIGFYSHFTILG